MRERSCDSIRGLVLRVTGRRLALGSALALAASGVVLILSRTDASRPQDAPVAATPPPPAEAPGLPTVAPRRTPAPQPAEAPTPPRPAARETGAERRARIDRTTREYLDSMRVPSSVAAEATALRVTDGALRGMYRAEFLLHSRSQAPNDEVLREVTDVALAALAAAGDEGFLAVAANARGNPENVSPIEALAKATWRPGLESSLLDWLRSASPREPAGAVLRALGAVDTREVREALRDSLRRYAAHASNFAAAASSLGALRDAESVPAIGARLREPQWSGLRPSLFDSLARIGGDGARDVLVAYARDATTSDKGGALEALARFDPAAARAEAEALDARGGLSPAEAARVRRVLGR